jgi:hypothetical protein
MTTPEGRVKAAIKARLAEGGWLRVPIVASWMSQSGVSDLLCCAKGGRFAAIEAKADSKGRLTPLQAAFLAEVSRRGGAAAVVHAENLARLGEWMEEAEAGRPAPTLETRPAPGEDPAAWAEAATRLLQI